MAVPARATVEPSGTVRGWPASTVGGLLGLSVMVMSTVAGTVAVPSETVSVNRTVVFPATLGAVKVVDRAFWSAKVMDRSVELWVHR